MKPIFVTGGTGYIGSAVVRAAAEALGVPLRMRLYPRWLCQLYLGPVVTEYITAHSNFLNEKLRRTGFEFKYPTAYDGLPPVVREWRVRREGDR